MHKPRILGNSIAPWRFILFFAILVVAGLVGGFGAPDPWLGVLVGFDLAAAVFLLTCISILKIRDPNVLERAAERSDANRTELLMLTAIVMGALLITIGAVTANVSPEPATKIVIILTLVLAWLFSNTVYALHYAHMAYASPGKGSAGLDFPNTKAPVFWDFIYFAFTIGMTFQTSDVSISSDRIRRVVTLHSFAAFIFNIGVLAFTINVLGVSS